MKRKEKLFFYTVFAGAAATLYQLWEHGVPVRREYTVEVPEELSGLRFLLLSDLHCNPLLCKNNYFLRQLAKERPDVILLAGDMISKYGKKANQRVPAFLKALSGIAPVVYGMGNHEEVLRTNAPQIFEAYARKIKEMGIFFPDNEVVSLILHGKNIDFAGMTISHAYNYKWVRKSLPPEALDGLRIPHPLQTVLLAHMPDFFPDYAPLAPLIVAGHIHGGIVRLPFIGGILSPQLYVPPYTRGCYKKNGSTLVVSAGIGSHSLPARLFNRVEYCIINTKTREQK